MNELSIKQFETLPFAALDRQALARIDQGMVEVDRAIKSFGRKNSQTTAKLMSLTMLSEGPIRRLRQCLAEIDKRRQALVENAFLLRELDLDLQDLQAEAVTSRIRIQIERKQWQKSETIRLMEGSLKDIAALQDAYTQIRVAHGIREDWDESDFEAAEVKAHVMSAFRLAYSDVMTHGRLSAASVEYLQQFGIHPAAAHNEVSAYVQQCDDLRKDGRSPMITHFHAWLEFMAQSFGEEYKKAMAHIGIENLTTEYCLFRQTLNT